VISLVGKYFQVGWVVILIIPVLMVDNIARFQGKILQNDSTGNPLTLPALVVFALLQSLYVCVITLHIAKDVFSFSDVGAIFSYRRTAARARYDNFSVGIVGCVDVVALEGFIDALSGYSVPFCKFFDCYKVNLIGGDDVNFYPGCQFHALPPSVIV